MGEWVTPPRLVPGDTVAVCAPAGAVEPSRLDAGLAVLSRRYAIRIDRDAVIARHGFLAGPDEQRAEQLNRALRDPDVRAIFVARGGYGITRILDLLDGAALRSDPKPIIGFSDATALLFWALSSAGVRGIHGPVVTQLGELESLDQQQLFDLLEAESAPGVLLEGAACVGEPGVGSVSGPLLGGNLCLLSHLVGTPFFPSLSGAVLFTEDVGERPYAVDRYLTHLRAAGHLDGVCAALVCDFVGCEELRIEGSPDALAVVAERLGAMEIPALRLPGVGHGAANRALPFGARTSIDFDRGVVSIDEPAVC